MNMINKHEEELYYSFIDQDNEKVTEWIRMPAIVKKYTEDAVKASNFNHVPSSMSFFVLLGDLLKTIKFTTYKKTKKI